MSDPNGDERLVSARDFRNEPWPEEFITRWRAIEMPGPKLVPAELKGYEMRPAPDTSWIRMENVDGPARISRLPRWVHRWFAWQFGYFWLPCPLCRRPFGGHEQRDIDGKSGSIANPVKRWSFRAICPACTRARHPVPPVTTANARANSVKAKLKQLVKALSQ